VADEDLYEEWIAHPDQHVYVHQNDAHHWAKNAGWWRTQRLVTLEDVKRLGRQPERRRL
jgi:hypothetical protein